eukprot:scpid21189/ scgid28626/ 
MGDLGCPFTRSQKKKSKKTQSADHSQKHQDKPSESSKRRRLSMHTSPERQYGRVRKASIAPSLAPVLENRPNDEAHEQQQTSDGHDNAVTASIPAAERTVGRRASLQGLHGDAEAVSAGERPHYSRPRKRSTNEEIARKRSATTTVTDEKEDSAKKPHQRRKHRESGKESVAEFQARTGFVKRNTSTGTYFEASQTSEVDTRTTETLKSEHVPKKQKKKRKKKKAGKKVYRLVVDKEEWSESDG